MKIRYLFLALSLMFLISCRDNKPTYDVDISDIELDEIDIHRYEDALFAINTDSLKEGLKNMDTVFNVFLGENWETQANFIQLRDYITDAKIQRLYYDTKEAYTDLDWLSEELTEGFKHYRYHYPDYKIPEMYTYVSGLHYEMPVEYGNGIMVIGLDNYLGKDYITYKQLGLPLYKARLMEPEHISVDCFHEMAMQHTPPYNTKTLLDEMILFGKFLYFIDAMLPTKPDHLKIGYTDREIEWAQNNEANIWAFFIENELLFSRDFQNIKKYISDSPFTAGFGNDSPGRLGVWTGWQIVRNYMENNPDISLQQLLNNQDSQEILQKAGYKPQK